MHTRKIAASLALLGVFALAGCSSSQQATEAFAPGDQVVRTLPAPAAPVPGTATPAAPAPGPDTPVSSTPAPGGPVTHSPAQTTPAPATPPPANAAPATPILTAPVPTPPVPTPPASSQTPANRGFAYNKIAFEVVGDGALPAAVKQLVREMKEQAAEKTVVVDGTTYAIITAGERTSGGYAVEVSHVGDSEGRLEIVYSIKQPAPGQMVTEAITYPYTVIKFKDGANLPVSFREVK